MTDYKTFYGFSEDPFKDSPNPKFFFPAESHNEALLSLQYGIYERKGFMLLLGERGIGKTTLINYLRSTLDAKVKIAFIPRSNIPYKKLLIDILHQLDVPLKLNLKGSMLHELYYHLIKRQGHDENVAIILDEAHDIGEAVVEEVRLLANLETSTTKLIQIVLCGELSLRDKLRADTIRQIGQRIVITSSIEPMTEEESLQYIDHRLKIVGSSSSRIFTDEALNMISKKGGGIPRAINILCGNALSIGCGLGEKAISASTVRKIKKEKRSLKKQKPEMQRTRIQSRLPLKIFAGVLVLVAVATGLFFGKNQIKTILNQYEIFKSVKQKASEQEVNKRANFKVALKKPTSEVSSRPVGQEHPLPEPSAPMMQPNNKIHIKTIIEATNGSYLSSLARKIYNISNITLIDHVLELNPFIKDPNLILVKQKIKFPEITNTLLIKPASNGAFQVHLSTFASRLSAVEYSRDIAFKGKEIEIAPRQVSARETWYRVLVGPYANWDEASRAISEMQKGGILKSYPISPSKMPIH